jgi:CRP-like cAMP-binding protein
LTPVELERLMPKMRAVLFHSGQDLFHENGSVEQVYFPCSGVVSLVLGSGEGLGSGVEVGMVGREGVLGLPALVSGGTSPYKATVLLPGKGLSMPARVLCDEFRGSARLQGAVLKYMGAMMAQPARILFCNSRHSVEERLCRWLLTVQHRTSTSEMEVTHEQIAQLLGVRRSGISVAAGILRKDGIIDSRRGRTIILDAQALEQRACYCQRHRSLDSSTSHS